MQRRKFGRHDFDVSALGFGAMRLPVIDNDPAKIDEEKTREMIHYAIENGVDYIDTAYNYHREQSEIVVGKVLKEGYRDRVNLATKCPTWLIKSHKDFDTYLNIQLDKLQTDHIDMYLLHSLNKERWQSLLEAQVFKFLERAKSDGRIRYAGFSFHDDVQTFKKIVDSYTWDFCQIQFNFMDEYYQAGIEGLKYAAARGLAVVIMEPLRGGRLVKSIPPEVMAVWNQAPVKRTPADWALRWVWNHPEVTVVLSGMGTIEQVKENIQTAATSLPNSLTKEELALFHKVKQIYRARIKINCTRCEYCMPCPQKISIPNLFEAYNDAYMYNSRDTLVKNFDRLTEHLGNPANCIECGRCEKSCPQKLPIRQYLKDILADVGKK